MRIVYLCKRQYMRHDVITDRYARLYEQPYQLALRGHDVLGLCLSYRPTDERDEHHETAAGSLRWIGLAPGRTRTGLLGYPARSLAILREFQPDILIAASDSPHIVFGSALARRLGIPFAADLYDHFESFGLTRVPGMTALYRRALRQAAVVSCVSEPLAELVKNGYGASGEVFALPSTINRNVFFPRDRAECRRRLGLPQDARLIGTAGGLVADKGVADIYRAWEILAPQDDSLHLVLAGPTDPQCPPPQGPRVHYLGMLPHAKVAELICALDVGIVYVRDTPYGRYSFPQKAYEMAACRVPLAVARVGAMRSIFAGMPDCLYTPDSGADLAHCLTRQLKVPQVADIDIPDWTELGELLEAALQRAISASPNQT